MDRIEGDGQPAASPELYRLDGVVKIHGATDTAVRAVDGVGLGIGRGEFVVVAGPSGSGKSTLLTLLGALDRPSAGRIEFEGRDLSGLGDSELADLRRKTLGFIFQQFNLIPTLTARENVEVALAPAGLGGNQRTAEAEGLLDRVGLAARAGHLPSQLSGGEQQRVAIARALADQPEVLLADEPTGNLDSATGDAILALLYQLWEDAGLTVVLVSHDREIEKAAPRVLRMANGRVVADVTSDRSGELDRRMAIEESQG